MWIWAHPKATRNMLAKYAQADEMKEMYKEIWEENYSKFLELANWRSTLESFNKWYKENTDKEIEEIVDLLLYSLNMAHIDEITGSVVVSGWIPIADKGIVISSIECPLFSEKPQLASWIDYVMSFNNELLTQNPHTFMKLTSFWKYQLYDVMDGLIHFGQDIKHLRWLDDSYDTFNSLVLPMYFDNSRYERDPEIANALQRELNEYWSKRLICSWLRYCSDEQYPDMANLKEKQGDFLIRLERSHIKATWIKDWGVKTSNNFGYCIIEKGGKVKYIWDEIELFEEMYYKSYMDEP